MTGKQIYVDNPTNDTPVPGIYKHYKGKHYQVLGMARHSETAEWLVAYQALYGEKGYWLRPLSLWLEPVVSGTGTLSPEASVTKKRFELVNSNDISLDKLTQCS